MSEINYDADLANKTPEEVADLIATWREDESALIEASFDLLNAIEPWLRGLK